MRRALVVLLVVLPWARTAAAQWTDERAVGRFVCRADFALRPLEGLLDELVELDRELSRTLGLPDSDAPIEVYLFRDETSYAAYLRRHLPGVTYRRALYVKGRGPGVVFAYQSRQLATDLRHECTHAVLHATVPHVPLWLDEGLAVYFEPPADRRALGAPHLVSVGRRAALGIAPDIAALESKTVFAAEAEYRDAWAIVHFALNGPPPAGRALREYLGDLRTDGPRATPLSVRLQQHWPDTARPMLEHFRVCRETQKSM